MKITRILLIVGLMGGLSFIFTACDTADTDDADVVTNFRHHYIESDPDRAFDARFMGVQTMQNPADMWMIQEIITEVMPDYIVEAGTAHGGSALFYAATLRHVNPEGRVVTIDIEPRLEASIEMLGDRPALQGRVRALAGEMIEVITSNSLDPELVAELGQRTAGKKVMVILDSCHQFEHVAKEIEAYRAMISIGSYLIVQDTIIDEKDEWIERYARCPGYEGHGGPGRAVEEFLATDPGFVADESREKYLLTFYPGGYLKRID